MTTDIEALYVSAIVRERDRQRQRANEFRAADERVHAFACDSIACALSGVLADVESAKKAAEVREIPHA